MTQHKFSIPDLGKFDGEAGEPDLSDVAPADPIEGPEKVLAQRFFKLAEAGKIFGKTARTMRWWADTGRIRTIKIGSARFVTAAEIERLQTGAVG